MLNVVALRNCIDHIIMNYPYYPLLIRADFHHLSSPMRIMRIENFEDIRLQCEFPILYIPLGYFLIEFCVRACEVIYLILSKTILIQHLLV